MTTCNRLVELQGVPDLVPSVRLRRRPFQCARAHFVSLAYEPSGIRRLSNLMAAHNGAQIRFSEFERYWR